MSGYVVYLLRNKINGMEYVGATCDFDMRMRVHRYQHIGTKLSEAIYIFGWDNFGNKKLYAGIELAEMASRVESIEIKNRNTLYPNGYNMRSSGYTCDRVKTYVWEQSEEIISLYKQGYSIRRVADMFDVSYNMVWRILYSHGIKMREKNSKSDVWNHVSNIKKMYSEGRYLSEICDIFGVTSDTIRRILVESGVEIKKNYKCKSEVWDHAKEIIDMYLDGLTMDKISNFFDVNLVTIKRILIDNDIKIRNAGYNGGRYKSEVWNSKEEILDLYKQGNSTEYIGNQFGVSRNTINSILNSIKERGVEINKPKSKVWLHSEEILYLYKQGYSTYKIGKKFSVSGSTISNILKEHGVELRKSGRYSCHLPPIN